jgi:para-aminobenzoate synthetase component 1
MRLSASFPVDNLTFWKEQLENWSSGHTVFMLLDSNDHHSPLLDTGWDVLVGAGAAQTLQLSVGKAFEGLKTWQTQTNDWLFGVLGYDLKNEVEQLSSEHPDGIGFPDLLFFQPETVVGISGGLLVVHTLVETPEKVLEAIRTAPRQPRLPAAVPPKMLPRIATADYLDTVAAIRRHIVAGDVYEMNFCQEFFAENTTIDPLAVWDTLNKLARAPMAAFFRWHDRYLLSASPERFLKKEGKKLLSQPIKGTRRRAVVDDEVMRAALANSEKDRAENVMIVDLVRNDLARSCQSGTVEVPELFGIYTFETVHQMISTVTGQLRPSVHPIDALQYAFPPGSMTGAPKVMAMELIEDYEKTRRGLYAGALGYFDPAGNFDFNVLIRSVFYHQTAQYVSFQVGGAIVFDSVAEDELDECRVKAGALFAALGALQPAQ